jgi:hypothetical protein
MILRTIPRRAAACMAAALAVLVGGATAILGVCGPFTDVAADAFCPFVLEIFYLGITSGTTATTYDPTSNVTRVQMAAFLSRTVDSSLKRGSRRAALDQYWTTQSGSIALTTVGVSPIGCKSDGADIWVANGGDGTVSRVRASDGRLLGTWTGATNARGVVTGVGKVIISGNNPGTVYFLDPLTPGSVIVAANTLGPVSRGITFDGTDLWTANNGSVSIVRPKGSFPWTVTTVTTGFSTVAGPTFDGSNIWVTNVDLGTLLKLDSTGAILQTVTVGSGPGFPLYDGTNLWVPTNGTVSVVRPGSGAVLATLTGNNGLAAAFDGQRVMVTSVDTTFVSLWKAADLTPLGKFDLGVIPNRLCSDGTNFWISLPATGQLAKF